MMVLIQELRIDNETKQMDLDERCESADQIDLLLLAHDVCISCVESDEDEVERCSHVRSA
jgi:hypothetical protein